MYTTVTYGIGRGKIDEATALLIMRKRNSLWNTLVDIESDYRVKLNDIVANSDDGHSKRKEILQREDVHEQVLELTRERRDKVNEACRNSNLYWPNYTDVSKNYERARKKDTLTTHEFDESGKLCVHYQEGIDSYEVFSEMERKFQIDYVPDYVFSLPRGQRKKLTQTTARIRIGTVGKAPVWFELPIVLHRQIPYGIIRDVAFVRERIGHEHRWHVSITMDVQDPKPRSDDKVLKLSVGWKIIPEGILVASSDSERLVLPNDWISEFKKCRDLHDIKLKNPDKFDHLHSYESHLSDQLIARRREIYRVFSSRICDKYATILIDYVNLSWMKDKNSGASWSMNAAGINYLYSALQNAAIKKGTTIIKSKSGEVIS